jgi:hypothetical protein
MKNICSIGEKSILWDIFIVILDMDSQKRMERVSSPVASYCENVKYRL